MEYTAFRELHREAYSRYILARVRDAELSETIASTAFATLAAIWPSVISSARPEAVAWAVLGGLVDSTLHGVHSCTDVEEDEVYRVLPATQADVVVLRCRMALTAGQTAHLMGLEEPTVVVRLRSAGRSLPPRLAGAVEHCLHQGA
ncbi:hypothetical protein OG239_00400 [Streptomyces sp. NBC_00868]|uniref:hypothetical protein n=1 Tax=unclassified Streptomyces TaxID=2593676 RepID=UPI00324E6EB0|nr:hypothetical protein OG239_00400 [Streptomyces sp. NBC_00868]